MTKPVPRKKTWRADFFDDPEDAWPSRSIIISADTEAVGSAANQMGEATRIEFTRLIFKGN